MISIQRYCYDTSVRTMAKFRFWVYRKFAVPPQCHYLELKSDSDQQHPRGSKR